MTSRPTLPTIGTAVQVGPADNRIWHEMDGTQLTSPRQITVTSHVYRAIECGDIQWLDAPKPKTKAVAKPRKKSVTKPPSKTATKTPADAPAAKPPSQSL